MTGRVFTSPSDTMIMLPGTLQLTDCISYCQRNVTCKAINFETGLCIILSSSEISYPKALSPSQFPVYTIFGHIVYTRFLSLKVMLLPSPVHARIPLEAQSIGEHTHPRPTPC